MEDTFADDGGEQIPVQFKQYSPFFRIASRIKRFVGIES